MGAVGVAAAAWPFIDQMNPSSAALAAGTSEIDISAIQPGQQIVYKFRGHPLFVRRRTPAEIAQSKAVPVASLIDPVARNANLPDGAPATDADRAIKPEWLIVIGVCTHLGCVPNGFHPAGPSGRVWRLALPLPRLAVYDTSGPRSGRVPRR